MTHRDESGPIPVPRDVLDGIWAVRRTGQTNMLDRPQVIALADEMAHHATVLWIIENPGLYARGVFHGFHAEPEPGDQTDDHPDLDHHQHGAPDA